MLCLRRLEYLISAWRTTVTEILCVEWVLNTAVKHWLSWIEHR